MTELLIESKKNQTLCLIRSLHEKKYRREHGLFFLEGATLFFEALEAGLAPQIAVLSAGAEESLAHRVREVLLPTDARLLLVPKHVYDTVSAEQAPQGVLAVFSVQDVFALGGCETAGERYVVLERVRDPGNVGAMLRCAAAFGYRGAILIDCADLFNPKTVRACMGALFHLELCVCERLDEALSLVRQKGLVLYGTSPHTETEICSANWKVPFALLFGNEGAGATEEALEACDAVLTIPMQGMESLNAACASAVALYESVRD